MPSLLIWHSNCVYSMLEKEAGCLSLHRSLSWKTHGEKAAIAKAPILQRAEEGVMGEEEKTVEMDKAEISVQRNEDKEK